MTVPSFIFGGDTGLSYEDMKRRRKAVWGGRHNYKPVTIGHGLNALGHALRIRMEKNSLQKADKEGRESFNSAFDDWAGGAFGGGNDTPVEAPSNFSGDWDKSGLRDGIAATAAALEIDPIDLATAISYETAGTFDPTKRGPTTQWGQHRGLIQFGEPQAKKYGVNWDDPMGSQLGADGAVVKYLRDAGVKPGMKLLDIYSAINAGGVGLYDRSDAHNGGAPGTVRDKVEKQMSGHRAKALAMFKDYQPQTAQPVQVASLDPTIGIPAPGATPPAEPVQEPPVQVAQAQPQRSAPRSPANPLSGFDPELLRLLDSPYATPGQRALMMGMVRRQLEALQPPDPMEQLQLEKGRLELEQMKNPERRIVKGADGFNYYADTGERVIPGIEKDQASGSDRKTLKSADGRHRYSDTGELVFPDVEAPVDDQNDMTESERRIYMFNKIQQQASPAIDKIEENGFDPSNVQDRFANGVLGGNWLKSTEGQMYQAAASSWAEGALRLATGAAATPEEHQRIVGTYFAQAGDSLETIQFKQAMRHSYEQVLKATLAGDPGAEIPNPLMHAINTFYGASQARPPAPPTTQPPPSDPATGSSDDMSLDDLLNLYGGR